MQGFWEQPLYNKWQYVSQIMIWHLQDSRGKEKKMVAQTEWKRNDGFSHLTWDDYIAEERENVI